MTPMCSKIIIEKSESIAYVVIMHWSTTSSKGMARMIRMWGTEVLKGKGILLRPDLNKNRHQKVANRKLDCSMRD